MGFRVGEGDYFRGDDFACGDNDFCVELIILNNFDGIAVEALSCPLCGFSWFGQKTVQLFRRHIECGGFYFAVVGIDAGGNRS